MTHQRYEINVHPESIIIGNDAILKCSIPSFVTDFIQVDSWTDSESNHLGSNVNGIKCVSRFQFAPVNSVKFIFSIILIISYSSVVNQMFDNDVFKVNVILSNDIILKCVSPSHVADLISVTSWVDSEGNTYTSQDSYGNISHLTCYL